MLQISLQMESYELWEVEVWKAECVVHYQFILRYEVVAPLDAPPNTPLYTQVLRRAP
jgi:hypothetical protein